MTLPAQNDVRRAQASNSLQRDGMKWLDEDFKPGNQTTQDSANFARARSLTVDGVVYEIN